VKFTIPSDLAAVREVQSSILDDIKRHGYGSESTFAIKLALEEVLINAIKHGNKFDPKKKVHVESNVTREMAEIIIEDEGAGFERVEVPDPTLTENLTKCSGRGILLIEAYMSSVEYSNKGRRVRLTKKNDDGDIKP
jgi:serine/threonine-protein kinase RsbW